MFSYNLRKRPYKTYMDDIENYDFEDEPKEKKQDIEKTDTDNKVEIDVIVIEELDDVIDISDELEDKPHEEEKSPFKFNFTLTSTPGSSSSSNSSSSPSTFKPVSRIPSPIQLEPSNSALSYDVLVSAQVLLSYKHGNESTPKTNIIPYNKENHIMNLYSSIIEQNLNQKIDKLPDMKNEEIRYLANPVMTDFLCTDIPNEFICPLSGKIFMFPIIVDNITYEQEEYLKLHPNHTPIIYNYKLKKRILDYVTDNPITYSNKIYISKQLRNMICDSIISQNFNNMRYYISLDPRFLFVNSIYQNVPSFVYIIQNNNVNPFQANKITQQQVLMLKQQQLQLQQQAQHQAQQQAQQQAQHLRSQQQQLQKPAQMHITNQIQSQPTQMIPHVNEIIKHHEKLLTQRLYKNPKESQSVQIAPRPNSASQMNSNTLVMAELSPEQDKSKQIATLHQTIEMNKSGDISPIINIVQIKRSNTNNDRLLKYDNLINIYNIVHHEQFS